MATIRRSGNGWQALIRRKAHTGTQSKTFPTRREAEIWAKATEAQLTPQKDLLSELPLNVAEAITAFIAGPLSSHRSAANEAYPLKATAEGWLGSVMLSELTVRHLAIWRDQRLCRVKANTVMRELRILRVLLDWVRTEQGAEVNGNPARELKVKAGSDGRVAFLSAEEEGRLLAALSRRKNPDNAFLVRLALTTAMRRSELLGLRWQDIDLEHRVAQLLRRHDGLSTHLQKRGRALCASPEHSLCKEGCFATHKALSNYHTPKREAWFSEGRDSNSLATGAN